MKRTGKQSKNIQDGRKPLKGGRLSWVRTGKEPRLHPMGAKFVAGMVRQARGR